MRLFATPLILACLSLGSLSAAAADFSPHCASSLPELIESGKLANFAFSCGASTGYGVEFCNMPHQATCTLALDATAALKLVHARIPLLTSEMQYKLAAYLTIWEIDNLQLVDTVNERSTIWEPVRLFSTSGSADAPFRTLSLPWIKTSKENVAIMRMLQDYINALPAFFRTVDELRKFIVHQVWTQLNVSVGVVDVLENNMATMAALLNEENQKLVEHITDWDIRKIEITPRRIESTEDTLTLDLRSPAFVREWLTRGQFPPHRFKVWLVGAEKYSLEGNEAMRFFDSEGASLLAFCTSDWPLAKSNRVLRLQFYFHSEQIGMEEERRAYDLYTYDDEAACTAAIQGLVDKIAAATAGTELQPSILLRPAFGRTRLEFKSLPLTLP